jgi:hypothetical protein
VTCNRHPEFVSESKIVAQYHPAESIDKDKGGKIKTDNGFE